MTKISERTICYLTPTSTNSLTFSSITSVSLYNVRTSSTKINRYFKKNLERKNRQYIIDELNYTNLDGILILHSLPWINRYKCPSVCENLCMIYDNNLSRIDFHQNTILIEDLINFCVANTHSSKSESILTKYPLANHKLTYKKIQEILLFNNKSNKYWLPKEICLNIMYLIRHHIIQDYFIKPISYS